MAALPTVSACAEAFAALRRDGAVICWGDELRGGDGRSVELQEVPRGGGFFSGQVMALNSFKWAENGRKP